MGIATILISYILKQDETNILDRIIMSALDRSPSNTNLLQPTKYILSIDKIPATQYFCQSVNLPGVSLSQPTYTTPLVDIPIMGNKLSYDSLNIKFLVDEQLHSWSQLYNWFLAMGSPVSTSDRIANTNALKNTVSTNLTNYSDLVITVLSALNNPVALITFTNAFPVSLSSITLDTELSADDVITAEVSFKYQSFSINTL